MRLHADRIDAFFRTFAAGQLIEALDGAVFLEIDCDRAGRLRHRQPLGKPVDADNLLCAEQYRAADRHLSNRTAAPYRDRIARLDVALHGGLPARRENIAEEQQLLVRDAVRHLDMGRVGEWHAQIFGLTAGIAARQVRIAEQPRGRVPERGIRELPVAIGPLADREVAAPTLLAFATGNRKRDHDALADAQRAVDAAPNLDDFSHRLVAHDIALLHAWHEVVIEVQIRAADRAARHLEDRVALMFDFGVGDSVAADVRRAVPDQSFQQALH